MKLKEKRRAASQFKRCEHMLSGTKTSIKFSHEPKRKNLKEARYVGSSFALSTSRNPEDHDCGRGEEWPLPLEEGSNGSCSDGGGMEKSDDTVARGDKRERKSVNGVYSSRGAKGVIWGQVGLSAHMGLAKGQCSALDS